MPYRDEYDVSPVPGADEAREGYRSLPIEPDDPAAIGWLLDAPEGERRERNYGYDPLETLPPSYRSEETLPPERPEDDAGIAAGDEYLDTLTFHRRVDDGVEPVHHYVIQEVYWKERAGELRMRPLDYCGKKYLEVAPQALE